jgi:hypothetical protein
LTPRILSILPSTWLLGTAAPLSYWFTTWGFSDILCEKSQGVGQTLGTALRCAGLQLNQTTLAERVGGTTKKVTHRRELLLRQTLGLARLHNPQLQVQADLLSCTAQHTVG